MYRNMILVVLVSGVYGLSVSAQKTNSATPAATPAVQQGAHGQNTAGQNATPGIIITHSQGKGVDGSVNPIPAANSNATKKGAPIGLKQSSPSQRTTHQSDEGPGPGFPKPPPLGKLIQKRDQKTAGRTSTKGVPGSVNSNATKKGALIGLKQSSLSQQKGQKAGDDSNDATAHPPLGNPIPKRDQKTAGRTSANSKVLNKTTDKKAIQQQGAQEKQ